MRLDREFCDDETRAWGPFLAPCRSDAAVRPVPRRRAHATATDELLGAAPYDREDGGAPSARPVAESYNEDEPGANHDARAGSPSPDRSSSGRLCSGFVRSCRYEVDQVEGYLAGMATYVLAGELALAEVLAGELPRPEFPAALRQVAPGRWHDSAAFSLATADTAAARHDVVSCAGLLAKAAIEVAQAAQAERGEWTLNEKGIVRRAGRRARGGDHGRAGGPPV